VKIWDGPPKVMPNFTRNLHKEAVRDVAWAPSDQKFVTASADYTLAVWDLEKLAIAGNDVGSARELSLSGHGKEVTSVDWHATKALFASGAKDGILRLWDPRTGVSGATISAHMGAMTSLRWSPTQPDMLATCSLDQTLRVWDVRKYKDGEPLTVLRHGYEMQQLAWHPVHEELIATVGSNRQAEAHANALAYWLVDGPSNSPPVAEVLNVHQLRVCCLAWHPLGHMLCTGGQDEFDDTFRRGFKHHPSSAPGGKCNFWARARPGWSWTPPDLAEVELGVPREPTRAPPKPPSSAPRPPPARRDPNSSRRRGGERAGGRPSRSREPPHKQPRWVDSGGSAPPPPPSWPTPAMPPPSLPVAPSAGIPGLDDFGPAPPGLDTDRPVGRAPPVGNALGNPPGPPPARDGGRRPPGPAPGPAPGRGRASRGGGPGGRGTLGPPPPGRWEPPVEALLRRDIPPPPMRDFRDDQYRGGDRWDPPHPGAPPPGAPPRDYRGFDRGPYGGGPPLPDMRRGPPGPGAPEFEVVDQRPGESRGPPPGVFEPGPGGPDWRQDDGRGGRYRGGPPPPRRH